MISFYLAATGTKKDRDKISKIYEEYYGTMLYTACKILPGRAMAEDAVSEAFIKIIKNIDKIQDISSYEARAYIVIITKNTALDLLRKQKRENEIPIDDAALPDDNIPLADVLSAEEACEAIVKCIGMLSPVLSEVLHLSVVLEHSHDEIAELLGITKDAVKMRLSRAKKEVRLLLRKEGLSHEK